MIFWMRNALYGVLIMVTTLAACGTTGTSSTLIEETEAPQAVLRPSPFTRGVNFAGWMEASGAEKIPFTKYTEQDFADVKNMGADVIRLPVRLHDMTGSAPGYVLDPLLLKFLDLAVDWAEKYKLHLIIDNHSFDPEKSTDENIDKILLPVWAQVAERYKNRSDYILYEILNEPHEISDERWGEIQGMAIETIRKIDQKHFIVIGGASWNGIDNLYLMPEYNDPKLIYTFHFYDPFLFTHQGATWCGPLFDLLEGVPFPADKNRMPKLHAQLRGTWLEQALKNDYPKEASPEKLYSTLDKVVAFSLARDVAVFCGEFGVFMPYSPPEDRVRWYEFVTNALERRNISRASWDYRGGFGIFNIENGDFATDVNTGVVRAMGFTPPSQQPRQTGPIKSGFTIYDDYPAQGIYVDYWGQAVFSLYDVPAAEGDFAIRWGNCNQYDAFVFTFTRNSDFSYLEAQGYCLEFAARTERPVRFDVRFLNPENATSTPWRISYTVDEAILPPDGKWHTIRIPLSAMREQGAWVQAKRQWLNPQREYTWNNVHQLEFAAEQEGLVSRIIRIDSIKIVEP
jgi:endoglucanase